MNTNQYLHRFRRMRQRAGFTLFELLITISILGMITIVIVNLFISAGQFTIDEQTRIEVGESTSRVLGPLDRALREGESILATATVGGTTYTTSTDTVVFSMPSIDSAGDTVAGTSDTAVITLDTSVANNTRLRLIIEPATSTYRPSLDTPVVEHVKDFYIRYTTDTPTSSTTINPTIQVNKTVRGRVFTRTNILYGVLRNHP